MILQLIGFCDKPTLLTCRSFNMIIASVINLVQICIVSTKYIYFYSIVGLSYRIE